MTKEKIIEKIIDEIKIDSKDFAMCYDIVEFSIGRVFTELEALQSRSCEGCKYYGGEAKQSFCVLRLMPAHMYEFEFCCNRYEPKEVRNV